MTDFHDIFLKEKETIVDLQKKIMECFGETIPHKLNEEDSFLVGACSITLVISNFLHSYGIKNTKQFMQDLTNNVSKIHKNVGIYAHKMFYKDGKKVSESGIQ